MIGDQATEISMGVVVQIEPGGEDEPIEVPATVELDAGTVWVYVSTEAVRARIAELLLAPASVSDFGLGLHGLMVSQHYRMAWRSALGAAGARGVGPADQGRDAHHEANPGGDRRRARPNPPSRRNRMTTHRCPPDGSGETPCCGLSPLELPLDDRMTVDGEVDCDGGIVRCPSCGKPMSTGGFALACGRGGESARIPLPAICTDQACRAARDEAALERAIVAGVIDR